MKDKQKTISLRVNVSIEANDAVEKFQAQQRLNGIKITKDEAVDIMLKSFNTKK